MRTCLYRLVGALVSVIASCFPAMADTVEDIASAIDRFDVAVAAYEDDDFSAAHGGFTEVSKAYLSSELCSNLGSTAYRIGNDGEAALWFRRALVLDSQSTEAKQNLRFLKRRLGFLRFDDGALGQYSGVLRTPVWRFAFALFTGIAVICFVAVVFLRMPSSTKTLLIWGATVATVLGCVTGIGWWAKAGDRSVVSLYVVVKPDSVALAAPNRSAGRVVVVPPGTEVEFLEMRGAWVYAEIPGGSRGWIRASQVEQLWPFSRRLIQ